MIERSGLTRQAERTNVLEHCQEGIRKFNQIDVRYAPSLCKLWNKSHIANRTSLTLVLLVREINKLKGSIELGILEKLVHKVFRWQDKTAMNLIIHSHFCYISLIDDFI